MKVNTLLYSHTKRMASPQHQAPDFVCTANPMYEFIDSWTEVSTFVRENVHCESEEEQNPYDIIS